MRYLPHLLVTAGVLGLAWWQRQRKAVALEVAHPQAKGTAYTTAPEEAEVWTLGEPTEGELANDPQAAERAKRLSTVALGGKRFTAYPLRSTVSGGFARLTYRDAGRVAKRLGARLPTEAEVRMWDSAPGVKHLSPCTQPAGPLMATREAADKHDACVLAQVGDWRGPISGAGKHWIAGAPPGRALNFGWKRADGSYIQTLGNAHNDLHTDYSQTTILVWDE